MFNKNIVYALEFVPKRVMEPQAWVGHMPFVAWLIAELEPKVVVELGTHTGNSLFSICQSVKENCLGTRVYAVDTWEGEDHAGRYGPEVYEDVLRYNQSNYQEICSLLKMKFDDAIKYFNDGSIDLLHIDGLHTYDAVCHDYETWLPKLSKNGMILFHDTNVKLNDFGVWKFWDEIISNKKLHVNFLYSYGLGVLPCGDKYSHDLLALLDAESNTQKLGKRLFSNLASRLEANQILKTDNAKLNEAVAFLKASLENITSAHSSGIEEKNTLQIEVGLLKGELEKFRSHMNSIECSKSFRLAKFISKFNLLDWCNKS